MLLALFVFWLVLLLEAILLLDLACEGFRRRSGVACKLLTGRVWKREADAGLAKGDDRAAPPVGVRGGTLLLLGAPVVVEECTSAAGVFFLFCCCFEAPVELGPPPVCARTSAPSATGGAAAAAA